MPYDPRIHHRRSIRLPKYDYSQTGAYFITIITQGRECLFGDISHGEMRLNPAGELVTSWWRKLSDKFPATSVEVLVVMPNHLHGIIVIEGCRETQAQTRGSIEGQTHGSAPTGPGDIVGADLRVRPNAPISQMVQWFKTMTTNAYIHSVKESGWAPFKSRLWQRNYYEHVIRNAADYEPIFDYIESNPSRWTDDEENPSRT